MTPTLFALLLSCNPFQPVAGKSDFFVLLAFKKMFGRHKLFRGHVRPLLRAVPQLLGCILGKLRLSVNRAEPRVWSFARAKSGLPTAGQAGAPGQAGEFPKWGVWMLGLDGWGRSAPFPRELGISHGLH